MNSAPNEHSEYEKALERALDEGRVLFVNGAIVEAPVGQEAMFAQMRAKDRLAVAEQGPPPDGWDAEAELEKLLRPYRVSRGTGSGR